MKKTRLYINGTRVKDVIIGQTKWQIFKYKFIRGFKKTLIASFLVGSLVGAYKLGNVTTASKIVLADRILPEAFPNILEKICKAESGGNQFSKNGDVVRGKVNKSDIGYCQINETIWNDQARKLGYDIYTLEGNKAMALWLLNKYGSEPWYLSKTNWK